MEVYVITTTESELSSHIHTFVLDILAEALYLSVDPHMRTYMDRFPLGVTMLGDQIAKYFTTHFIEQRVK